MNLLAKFNQTFGFTPAERRVVLILLSTFLVGITIKIAKSAFDGPSQYDYASIDSTFSILSDTQNVTKTQLPDSPENRVLAQSDVPDLKIDINTATKAQFVRLPGIGDVIAERILSYRNRHGRFKSIRELLSVEGIGEKNFKKIASFVTIVADHE